jgi:hypothetical protein
MAKFFDFWDPLERRYVFNSFLVVVGLVEVLILIFTLVWQIDVDALLGGQARAVPFPWKEYLLASFAAPIALLFLFGVIIHGFEAICREEPAAPRRRRGRWAYLLGLLVFLVGLVLFFQGKALLVWAGAGIKKAGLGGAYLLIAVLGLALLYLPLRLLLRYRLQKKALEYQYLLKLAERGLILPDAPRVPPPGEKSSPQLPGSQPGPPEDSRRD